MQNGAESSKANIIQKKFSAFFYGIILLAMAFFAVWKREIFFYEYTDFSSIQSAAVLNDPSKIKTVRELDIRVLLMAGFLFIYFFYLFYRALTWKLEYGENSFTLKHEFTGSIEYKKIISIVHYTARYRRSNIDEFIVSYMGIPEFGYKEEVQKVMIKHYPYNYKIKEFFTFVKEKNPKILFRKENAGSDGLEVENFDYFTD